MIKKKRFVPITMLIISLVVIAWAAIAITKTDTGISFIKEPVSITPTLLPDNHASSAESIEDIPENNIVTDEHDASVSTENPTDEHAGGTELEPDATPLYPYVFPDEVQEENSNSPTFSSDNDLTSVVPESDDNTQTEELPYILLDETDKPEWVELKPELG